MSKIENQNNKTGQQREGWSKLYSKPVSDEEYRQIVKNLNDYLNTLKSWADKEIRLNEVNVREIKNGHTKNH